MGDTRSILARNRRRCLWAGGIAVLGLLAVGTADARSVYYYCPAGLVSTGTNDPLADGSNCAYWLLPTFPLGGTSDPAENGTQIPGLDVLPVWQTTEGAGVTVAVLDSGVDPAQSDYAGNLLTGWSTYDQSSDTADANGHGTLIASIIAAQAGNGGYVGIAPQAKLLPVRVTGGAGGDLWSDEAAVAGVYWAVAHGARILNCSWGSLGRPIPGMAEALKAAERADVLVVIAAGNDGANLDGALTEYPDGAGLTNTLTVGSVDETGQLAADSNYGASKVQIASLGDLYGDLPGNASGGAIDGTSAATATVSGVAALLLSAYPDATAAQVRQALISGATPVTGLKGKVQANGLLSAAGSLASLAQILSTQTENTASDGQGSVAAPRERHRRSSR